MRRILTGLWAGRAWHKLYCAQQGWYSPEPEQLEWGQLHNQCSICRSPTGLTVQWMGPGYMKPQGTPHSYPEMSRLLHKPVKVLDYHICGTCRVVYAPRMRFIAYWDYRTDDRERRRCQCVWTGTRLTICRVCNTATGMGQMIRIAGADGWQVSKYVDSIDTPQSYMYSSLQQQQALPQRTNPSCRYSSTPQPSTSEAAKSDQAAGGPSAPLETRSLPYNPHYEEMSPSGAEVGN